MLFRSIMPFGSAHELWTKLEDKYDVSNIIEEDCIASTSGRDEFSSSSTSPMCGKTQGNSMVSGDGNCNVDIELTIDDSSSLSYCHASSLDLNTTSTKNDLHACVDSPCISCQHIVCLNIMMICLLYLVHMIKMIVFPLVFMWLTM